jgi:hypothetical protein
MLADDLARPHLLLVFATMFLFCLLLGNHRLAREVNHHHDPCKDLSYLELWVLETTQAYGIPEPR